MVFGLFFLPLSRIWSQKSDLINKSFTRFLLQSLPEKERGFSQQSGLDINH